jgi:hypothetical protein
LDGLQNLMDNPNIDLFTAGIASMIVTSDGIALTPSLANFDSLRPIPLAQLEGEWFVEKVFASDTGDAEATYADPVIVRDGDRGRLAIVHATTEHKGLLNGEVAAEIIINALLAPPMTETPPEQPTETVVETPPETPPEMEMSQPTGVDFTDPAMHLYFSFDELNGNQVIDHSQYQNHGMLVGNPQLVEGRFGKALEFNGQTDYVEVPHDDSLIVDKTFTIMAWIKTPRSHGTVSVWQGIVAKGNSPRSYSLYTAQSSAEGVLQSFVRDLGEDLGKSTFETIFGKSAIEEGVVHWGHLSTGAIEGSVSMPIVLNEWQHVVAQMDENNVHRYWINGEATDWTTWGLDSFQVTTRSGLPGANDTSPVRVGNTMESRHFLGLIDEVRIWRRALSEDEILEQMRQGLHAE